MTVLLEQSKNKSELTVNSQPRGSSKPVCWPRTSNHPVIFSPASIALPPELLQQIAYYLDFQEREQFRRVAKTVYQQVNSGQLTLAPYLPATRKAKKLLRKHLREQEYFNVLRLQDPQQLALFLKQSPNLLRVKELNLSRIDYELLGRASFTNLWERIVSLGYRLRDLEALNVSYTRLRSEHLNRLLTESYQDLTSLNLRGCQDLVVSELSSEALSSLANLTHLDLTDTPTGIAGLDMLLPACPKLRSLSSKRALKLTTPSTGLTAEARSVLAGLTQLAVSFTTNRYTNDLRYILPSCLTLQSLTLSGYPGAYFSYLKIKDYFAAPFAQIIELILEDTPIDINSLNSLLPFTKSLQTLRLRGKDNVNFSPELDFNEETVETLAKVLNLDISGTGITNRSFKRLWPGLLNLESLNLQDCRNLDLSLRGCVELFKSTQPDSPLKHLNLLGTNIGPAGLNKVLPLFPYLDSLAIEQRKLQGQDFTEVAQQILRQVGLLPLENISVSSVDDLTSMATSSPRSLPLSPPLSTEEVSNLSLQLQAPAAEVLAAPKPPKIPVKQGKIGTFFLKLWQGVQSLWQAFTKLFSKWSVN